MDLTLEAFGLDVPPVRYVRGWAGKPAKRSWVRVVLDPKTGEERTEFCCMESEGHKHG